MSHSFMTIQPMKDAIAAQTRRFAREEDGIMTVWVLFVILMMVTVGGIQLDFMRHELERSRLQAVSDRAVLAAADLDQTQELVNARSLGLELRLHPDTTFLGPRP